MVLSSKVPPTKMAWRKPPLESCSRFSYPESSFIRSFSCNAICVNPTCCLLITPPLETFCQTSWVLYARRVEVFLFPKQDQLRSDWHKQSQTLFWDIRRLRSSVLLDQNASSAKMPHYKPPSSLQHSWIVQWLSRLICYLSGICWAAVRFWCVCVCVLFFVFWAFNHERHLAPERCRCVAVMTCNARCTSNASTSSGHYLSQLRGPQHQLARPALTTAQVCKEEQHWGVRLCKYAMASKGAPTIFLSLSEDWLANILGGIWWEFWGGFFEFLFFVALPAVSLPKDPHQNPH